MFFFSLSLSFWLKETDLGARRSHAEAAEILDAVVTRSRGEVKHINSPKVTSSTSTPASNIRSIQSPRLSEKAYSPRLNELRQEPSPHSGARGYSPRTSKLGDSSAKTSSN